MNLLHKENGVVQHFNDMHLGFGTVSTSGQTLRDTFTVSVETDERQWDVTSTLVVSAMVPITSLIMCELSGIEVQLAVTKSKSTTQLLEARLGTELVLFSAACDSDKTSVFRSTDRTCWEILKYASRLRRPSFPVSFNDLLSKF